MLNYEKIAFLKKALRIRMVEEHIADCYKYQEMRCPVHLSIGQEANAVLIAECLTKDDYMVSTHRGHAHYLAKGGKLEGLIGELYGKRIGCAGGNGGSMHLVDHTCGFLGSTSIVGGTIPVGVGAAWAAKIKGEDKRSVICIGDAAVEEGVFHESINFAALHNLNTVFFIEDNFYSCFTHKRNRQPERQWFKIAQAYGVGHLEVKWDNFWNDFNKVKVCLETSKTPVIITCDAYRFVEHCGPNQDDDLGYRDQREIEVWRSKDPIDNLIHDLVMAKFLTDNMYEQMRDDIKSEIVACFAKVSNAENPDPNELGAYLYAY